MQLRTITEAQARHAMKHGDFSADVVQAAPVVVIVLTQSWCPQWTWMQGYLETLELGGAECFILEYDREPWFDEFLEFKEQVLNNDEVPYVRVYRFGKLVATSNYLSKPSLVALVKGS